MKLTRIAWIAFLVIAVTAQAVAAVTFSAGSGFEDRLWLLAFLYLAVGGLAGIGLSRYQFWVGTAFLWWAAIWVAAGTLIGFSAGLLLISLCAALAFWDLARLLQRTFPLAGSQQLLPLEKRHLGFLFMVLAGGFLASLVALMVKIQLNFILALILALVLLLGIGQLVRMLR